MDVFKTLLVDSPQVLADGTGLLLASNNLNDLDVASSARTNLGVAIGSDVQAHDADLDSWAGVTRASGFDTFAATPSSANLAGLVSDETGTGALVFANSPTLVTPALGTPASGVVTNLTGTASININGTVGATTPSTGAFTTASASTSVTTPLVTNASTLALAATGANIITASTNGVERMRIDSSGRLLVGTSSASGSFLLQVDTTDATIYGVRVGRGAGAISTNTALGSGALNANTTGAFNTANGRSALYNNTTGSNNTANGLQALYSNTTGSENTANGAYALYFNTTGDYNTANGYVALYSNTTGNYNTADGHAALLYNTTGSSNTANGRSALYNNTTGANNTANGYAALYSNTTGANNTANGYAALYSNTTGAQNTANGDQALYSNTTGSNNTANGRLAGYGDGLQPNTTGSNNAFIGHEAMGASSTASNVITLGNGSIATLRCQVTTITSLSDERDKKNIATLGAGLEFLNKLRPVSFTWDTRDKYKVDIDDTGFIAQELLAAQTETGITIPNLVSQENPDRLEAGYGTLIPVLVNAVQELTAMVKQLQDEITTLKEDN